MNTTSVQDLISACWLAVRNTAKDADTAKKMSNVNFNDKRMRELENLTQMVEELEQHKITTYNEGLQISEQIEQDALSLRPVFMKHVAIARFTFRESPALLKAFIPKPIVTNKWGWLAQAQHFYALIISYADRLSTYNLSQEELEQSKASVNAIIKLRQDRMWKKGRAEDSTDNRNQMVKQLKNLLKEFHAAARLALKDNPQRLEAFGIRVRSLQK